MWSRQSLKKSKLLMAMYAILGAAPLAYFYLTRFNQIWTADATGKGPFWHALANGNPGAVTELLKCGADVLEKYDNGWNALHIAAKSGDPRVCGTIISAMGPANRAIFEVNGDTNTALHIALRSGHDKAGVLLLNTGFDPRKPDFRGNTPLDLILQAELTETFELLLRLTKDQWPLQRLRWPQLVYAASRGTGASVRMILRAMAFGVVEPFIRPKQPFFGLTPLHCFSKRWREATDPLEMLSHLFALGEDVNTVDRAGNTPLHLLLLSREEDDDPEQYLQVVHEMLVHYKCPIHHQNVNGNTILHFAACHNDIRLLEMVVKRIDKPTILAVNKQGLTALHCAVNPRIETTGRTDVFEGIMEVSRRYPTKPVIHLLVSKGIYVDAKTNAGFTALHMACADNKKIQAVEALLEAGADAGMKDYEGNPPLHWANVRGCDKAILTLLSHRSELHENCYTCDPRLWGLQDPTSSKDTAKRMEVVYGVEWMPIANEADLWDDGGPGNAAS
jgi:ankyrin repeat protein